MNQKQILAYILFAALSIVNAQCVIKFKGHDNAPIIEAEFSPDSTMIVTVANDGTLWIWETYNNENPLFKVQCDSLITAFAFAPNSRLLAVGCDDGHVEIRELNPSDLASKTIRVIDHPSNQSVTSLAFTDNIDVSIAYSDNTVYGYNIETKKKYHLHSDTSKIHKIQWSHGGDALYITKYTEIEVRWRDDDGFHERSLVTSSLNPIRQARFSKTNINKCVEVMGNGTIIVREFGTKNEITIAEQAIYAEFSPVDDGMILVAHSCGVCNVVYMIRLGYDDNKPYLIINNGEDIKGRFISARFNHDGMRVIATTTNGEAIMWSILPSLLAKVHCKVQ